ncbi:hypothetical protein [Amphibacillus cookii]|uniref:hypothetical protein n=1 Tax=Amphibacillus cookii TaxID=767787 RepID=UPI00195C803A|nr:hypothetical protein [Amphibacillus cookii]MBM7541425.1 hypothetical protein [Amphibacillus cookii]
MINRLKKVSYPLFFTILFALALLTTTMAVTNLTFNDVFSEVSLNNKTISHDYTVKQISVKIKSDVIEAFEMSFHSDPYEI